STGLMRPAQRFRLGMKARVSSTANTNASSVSRRYATSKRVSSLSPRHFAIDDAIPFFSDYGQARRNRDARAPTVHLESMLHAGQGRFMPSARRVFRHNAQYEG